ncbi:MAG: DNA replication and repair protein RecF [Ignavibacteria bacterium]|nr:MAG: DNA replication and repair protein RecF [Ignavibacteria bacterium]
MILNRLRISQLRNHGHTDITCPDGTLLLLGENGAGKTTVLEAIAMLCTSRSFVTRQDKGILQANTDFFRLEGSFTAAGGTKREVTLAYSIDPAKKQIELDHSPLNSASDLIGQFPVVALSPQHRPITAGGPGERRSFIDFIISQVHHAYLMDLIDYRRTLRQRNALLSESGRSPDDIRHTIEAWDQSLAATAIRILNRRVRFIDEFTPYFQDAMHGVIGDREIVALTYRSSVEIDPAAEDAVPRYLEALRKRFMQDVRRGTTSLGPHRDDMEILLNGLDVRAQASQGQHKSVLISLKLGEYRFLDSHLDEAPILLLDDVFSELDDDRLERVLKLVQGLGQTFITTANTNTLRFFSRDDSDNLTLRIDEGVVSDLAEVA